MSKPKVYFIKSLDLQDPIMEETFLACKSQQVESISCEISDFLKIHATKPKLRNIVVLNKFSGDNFDTLKQLEQIRLVGPLCVLACLNDGISIPNCNRPLLNIAMQGTIICCSNIPKEHKIRIKEHVLLMNGHVTDDYLTNTTHLVTNSVLTVKYSVATESGINIMTPDWIDAIWKQSQNGVVRYTNEQFNKYKCPVFYNLRICLTGIGRSLITNISTLIQKNGGIYSREMRLQQTDVLICHGDNITDSMKYKAAMSSRGLACNIRCLSLQWIHGSVAKGYALPEDNYAVCNQSTPKAKGNAANNDMFLLISGINVADDATASCSTIDGTVLQYDQQNEDLSERIDLSVLKRANTFLDGFIIYLICFTADDLSFMQRALKYTGATRLDTYSDRISHIVVGEDKAETRRQELRTIIESGRNKRHHLVSVRWLIDSIKKQTPLAEEEYCISTELNPLQSRSKNDSPFSKKGLKLLRTDTSICVRENITVSKARGSNNSTFKAPDELQPYMQPDDTYNETLSKYWNDINTDDLAGVDILKRTCDDPTNKSDDKNYELTLKSSSVQTFRLLHFDSAATDELTSLIRQLGGRVLSQRRLATEYAIVPLLSDADSTLTVNAKHILTDIWLRECANAAKLIPVRYYHRPITSPPNMDVLRDCVVSTSAFAQWEQAYLCEVIAHLGGRTQGDLSRLAREDRGLLATTHLLTNSARNKKYAFAQRWGVPIVNSKWAEESLRAGKRMPEIDYPVAQEDVSAVSMGEQSKNDCFALPNPATPPNRREITAEPESPQIQSPAESQPSPNDMSPVSRQYHDILTRVKARVEQGLLYDSDCESPSSTRLTDALARLQTPETPDTPFTAKMLGPEATRSARKELREFLKKLPNNTPPRTRRLSTPISELDRRFVAKVDANYEKECAKLRKEAQDKRDQEKQLGVDAGDDINELRDTSDIATAANVSTTDDKTISKQIIEEKLRNLSDMLSSGTLLHNYNTTKPIPVTPVSGYSVLPDSQSYTVGWDYDADVNVAKREVKKRVFVITGGLQTDKDAIEKKIESLGATVAPEHTKFDQITHLLCWNVLKNEKTLCGIAAGKWVLHVDYVEDSLKAGQFLDEELYEFSNPKSGVSVESKYEERAKAAFYWRREVARTGAGAFHEMRAIIASRGKDNGPCANIVQAGGGTVIQSRPPYENNDYATHCLVDAKVSDVSELVPLAKCGIYCVPHIFVFNFLIKKDLDVSKCVIPELTKYYTK